MIIPALDIYNNNCVRLLKGKYSKIYEFCSNPIKVFLFYLNKKVKRIHIVDLNGAENKNSMNLLVIYNIYKISNYFKNSKIQIGGGIRTYKKIKYYSIFFYKTILSTLIFKKVFFLDFFFKKIMYSLDIKNKFIYSKGWKNKECKLNYFVKNNKLTKEIIYTNINKDGTMKGIKINNNILKKLNTKVIVSGGFKKYIKYNNKKIVGYISGISIYTKKESLKYAL
ncbi:HisA/HisF-related TIM barrel protein [Candidatus Vidania fulgoroideorum]